MLLLNKTRKYHKVFIAIKLISAMLTFAVALRKKPPAAFYCSVGQKESSIHYLNIVNITHYKYTYIPYISRARTQHCFSNTTTKCKVDRINGCWGKLKHILYCGQRLLAFWFKISSETKAQIYSVKVGSIYCKVHKGVFTHYDQKQIMPSLVCTPLFICIVLTLNPALKWCLWLSSMFFSFLPAFHKMYQLLPPKKMKSKYEITEAIYHLECRVSKIKGALQVLKKTT